MEVRVLGPLEIVAAGTSHGIAGVRMQVVLTVLSREVGRVVPMENLIDAIWSNPPRTARSQVQICVGSLRRIFTGVGRTDVIATHGAGYRLQLAPTELDASRFDQLVAEGKRLGAESRLAEAVEQLQAADALWRGPALTGVPGDIAESWRVLLHEQRMVAVEERIRLELKQGEHDRLIGELRTLLYDHPLRERLHAHLMLALYRADRQAEALEAYRHARSLLVEQLGIEPSAELSRLERAILHRDPSLDLPAAPAPIAPGRAELTVKHRQLPPAIADFTGRKKILAEICDSLSDREKNDEMAPSLIVISGIGGVGKTSLAVRAGHALAAEFPDAHLFVNLRGTSTTPERPTEVLVRFLRALGLAGTAIPETLAERVELFRSLLADRHVLLVLDDAADESQVLPLLPNTVGCGAIITSRARLTALPGARQVDLDLFTSEQSLAFLARVVGDRIRREPAGAAELVRLCGNLPIALRIAGARLASRPHWRVHHLVDRLRDENRLLDELVHRDLRLRSSIGVSYDNLVAPVQRLFRRLALIEGDLFPAWVSFPLLSPHQGDGPDGAPEELLERLVDVRLVDAEPTADGFGARYRLHDLIRIFARERLVVEEPPDAHRGALQRMLGGWLALAEEAHRREYGGDYTVLHGTAERFRLPEHVVDELLDRPMAWLEHERPNLVTAVRQAASHGLDELAWDLALTSVTLFETHGNFDDWAATADVALAATRRTGNRRGQAAMLHSLGAQYLFQQDPVKAERMFVLALRIFTEIGDEHGVGLVQRNLAYLDRMRGDDTMALSRYSEALTALRAAADRIGEAHVLANMARVLLDRDEVNTAREHLDEALAICRAVGSPRVEAQVLHRLGELRLHTGDLGGAGRAFDRTLEIVRDRGDHTGEAYALHGLGVVRRCEGRIGEAELVLGRALRTAQQVGDRLVEARVRHELGQLPGTGLAAAADQLTKAAELFETLQMPLWHARSLAVLAETHHALGDRDACEQCVREALAAVATVTTAEAEQLRASLRREL